MHLIESFALNSGLKIGKPYIYESYIPIPINSKKYITFQPHGQKEFTCRAYSYWQEVLDILRPHLNKKEIALIQLGLKDERLYKGSLNMIGKTNLNQAAYLIKNSCLHLGIDSYGVHFASGYGKKIVALYVNMLPSNSGPYWSKKKDVKLISPKRKKNELPSYAVHEDPKTIDRIKPEEIASAVCALLNIDYDYPYKTIYIGEEYSYKRVEIVPTNYVENWRDFEVDSMILRMDKFFDEKTCISQLNLSPCSIVTDKPINLEIIKAFKNKIIELVYFVRDTRDIEYIKRLKTTGIKLYLVCDLPEKKFNDIKIEYIDIAPIVHKVSATKEEFLKKAKIESLDDIYFKSSCAVIREQGLYSSYAKGDTSQINYLTATPQKVIDEELFWQDISRMMFFKKISS
tara:strand:+ start:2474 stop:3676 length:1203 start_codon:yes stop_codon:yes gene_type:complete